MTEVCLTMGFKNQCNQLSKYFSMIYCSAERKRMLIVCSWVLGSSVAYRSHYMPGQLQCRGGAIKPPFIIITARACDNVKWSSVVMDVYNVESSQCQNGTLWALQDCDKEHPSGSHLEGHAYHTRC